MKKKERSSMEFWTNYEKRYGEKVLAYVLGKYLSGWPDYEYPLWGLLIATDGGFRFHHFPHEGWLQAHIRMTSGAEPPKEKHIFIPREQILSAELRLEKNWWNKIFFYHPPMLALQYRHGSTRGYCREESQTPEQEPAGLLLAEAYQTAKVLIAALTDSTGKGAAG
jgi:hypothetical protein